jgi:hypothetical protein
VQTEEVQPVLVVRGICERARGTVRMVGGGIKINSASETDCRKEWDRIGEE